MLTTAAVLGPVSAGMIADSTGSFTPIFFVYTLLLALVIVPIALMRAPLPGPEPAEQDIPAKPLRKPLHSDGIGKPLRASE